MLWGVIRYLSQSSAHTTICLLLVSLPDNLNCTPRKAVTGWVKGYQSDEFDAIPEEEGFKLLANKTSAII